MEEFFAERLKANYDAAYIEIELSVWLEQENLQTVVYSALDSAGGDATAEVLDLVRSTYSGTKLLPYVRGGLDLESYVVLCRVDTLEGSQQEFRIRFRVREAP